MGHGFSRPFFVPWAIRFRRNLDTVKERRFPNGRNSFKVNSWKARHAYGKSLFEEA